MRMGEMDVRFLAMLEIRGCECGRRRWMDGVG